MLKLIQKWLAERKHKRKQRNFDRGYCYVMEAVHGQCKCIKKLLIEQFEREVDNSTNRTDFEIGMEHAIEDCKHAFDIE
jgi:hypothetical protein